MRRKKILITNQIQLIDFFKDNSLRMKKGSKISFTSPLKLDSNITFNGNILLGKNNIIGSNCVLNNVNIGDKNIIKMSSFVENSKICNQNIIGPFAYIRDNTNIQNKCIVGAYVEITRSTIKNKSFASHRAFIGDAVIGSGTIIGAGTVFCNYSFKTNSKQKSFVGSNCKIGSNVCVIAPSKIKSDTVIPATTKFKN
tara:strand:+ start:5404 stop:5994 length:591 start_codon:yes stop_codon:yes gene_type:complete